MRWLNLSMRRSDTIEGRYDLEKNTFLDIYLRECRYLKFLEFMTFFSAEIQCSRIIQTTS
jgi:hypothetical protein